MMRGLWVRECKYSPPSTEHAQYVWVSTILVSQLIWVTLYYPVLHCVTLCYPVLPCVILCYTVLPYVTLCYPVLHCVTLCYSDSVTLYYPLLLCVILCYWIQWISSQSLISMIAYLMYTSNIQTTWLNIYCIWCIVDVCFSISSVYI